MISDPDFFLEEFAEAGSDSFLVHWEGNNDLDRTVRRIKELGKRAGVVINPATPAVVLQEILPELDLVVVMTVNPGSDISTSCTAHCQRSGGSVRWSST
jgi:ribulose-phosphate 3-epimerase